MNDKLMVKGEIVTKCNVTVAGVEITSKEDWDRVLLKLEELIRENERLRKALEFVCGCERCVSCQLEAEKVLSNKEITND